MILAAYKLAELRLSPAAYAEIVEKLKATGRHDAILENGMLDMQGIGVVEEQPQDPTTAPRVCAKCHTPEGEPHLYRHRAQYEEVV